MDIVELKKRIEENTLDDSLFIMRWKDYSFIPIQYVNEIANKKGLKLSYIDSLDGYGNSNDDFFGEQEQTDLNVLIVEKFSTPLTNFDDYKNVVIICKEIEGDIEKYVVDIPKLEQWQIHDYMCTMCGGVEQIKLKWLQDVSSNNIYRIYNEMSKLMIFDKVYQDDMFNLINDEGGYGDMTTSNFFDFVNALKMRDVGNLLTLMQDIDNIDVEPIGIVTMLLSEFKTIIDIKLKKFNSKKDIDDFVASIGISQKKFDFYRNTVCNKYNERRLSAIYRFLLGIDYDLKSGKLVGISGDKYRFIDYIVCNLLSM